MNKVENNISVEILSLSRNLIAMVIVEGVCLRAIKKKYNFHISMHICVRQIGANGVWYNENIPP